MAKNDPELAALLEQLRELNGPLLERLEALVVSVDANTTQAARLEAAVRELVQLGVNRIAPPANPGAPPLASPARVHRNVPAIIRKHLPPL